MPRSRTWESVCQGAGTALGGPSSPGALVAGLVPRESCRQANALSQQVISLYRRKAVSLPASCQGQDRARWPELMSLERGTSAISEESDCPEGLWPSGTRALVAALSAQLERTCKIRVFPVILLKPWPDSPLLRRPAPSFPGSHCPWPLTLLPWPPSQVGGPWSRCASCAV